MARTVAIGVQDFETLITRDCFYVDKTAFIKEWWESNDSVTLIARPRRFGKTLTMSMLEQFFSLKYAGRGELFEKLSIWQEEKYRQLQGTYPVIALSFANVKEETFEMTRKKINMILVRIFEQNAFLKDSGVLGKKELEFFERVSEDMDDSDASMALNCLSDFLSRYYGKKVIILLDEYDTPMQEAYVKGYWKEIVSFTRSLFNSTFKTNPYLERAIMTGITRVSKESIFSDLNNLKVVTTTSDEYTTAFGFTEQEVFASLEEYGLGSEKEKVKRWYDGFIFGKQKHIYNPWSIINFLDTWGKYKAYWANTSSNSLVGKLLREGDPETKKELEALMKGGTISTEIDEQIVYNQLGGNRAAIWSLLLASGYLKVMGYEQEDLIEEDAEPLYELALTNYEVRRMFYSMVREWFNSVQVGANYNDFIKALLLNDLKAMNRYMNRVALATFSHFDTGTQPSESEPERFYHGFVLGLMVDLATRYSIKSNRESGFGRYDVMLKPKDAVQDDAYILEFKVHDPDDEEDLAATVEMAKKQIAEKQYAAELISEGIPAERIHSYGFAFRGKEVKIG